MPLLLCILLFLAAAPRCAAQEQSPAQGRPRARELRVSFSGNEALSSSELLAGLRAAGLLAARSGAGARIAGALLARYHGLGYYLCAVEVDSAIRESDPPAGSTDPAIDAGEPRALVCRISEGPPARVGTLELLCDSTVPRDILEGEIDSPSGALFSEALLREDIDRLLEACDNAGFPFVSIAVERLSLRRSGDSALMDIRLRAMPGVEFFLNEITVQGNTRTRENVIIRETRLSKDDRYSAVTVGDVRRRLERLNFFSSVSEPELYLRNGQGGIALRVAEGSANTFDGIIGYQPSTTASESGYLTGLVKLSFRNLFGTGRRLFARWERSTPEAAELELRYLEPWVAGLPVDLEGSFAQRSQDSAFVRRALTGTATFLASSVLNVSGSVLYNDVIPSQSNGIPGLMASSTTSGSVELLVDTRDNPANPASGMQLRNSYSGGYKRASGGGATGGGGASGGGATSEFIQRLEADAWYFHRIIGNAVGAVGLHGRELRGSSVDASDMYLIGGAATLRGYREEQFRGMRALWANIECRYSLARRSYAFLFFDAGYVSAPYDAATGEQAFSLTREGYGFGARMETPIGILGVSYALGRGDGIANGKIHFGLVNDF